MNEKIAEAVASVVRGRRTEKVLCDIESAVTVAGVDAERNRCIVLEAVRTAGWAPFHYSRNEDGIAEPWRTHILWQDDARRAALHMRDKLGVTTKEPRLAAACSALVLVTWLPEFYNAESQARTTLDRDKQILRDEEHLAATSAMVQNLLLLLTAHDMGTYWSTGGRFRQPEMFSFLGIPKNERLLAAVFIEYPEVKSEERERKPGAQRNNRGDSWIREVMLAQ